MTRLFRLDILLMIVVPLAVAVGAETGNFAGLDRHWRWPQDVFEM